MPLSWNEIKDRALGFSNDWKDARNEDADAKSFLDAFFDVFGISRRKIGTFEHRVKKLNESDGYIDLLWKGVILVEMKSRGKDLTRAFEQAKEYTQRLPDFELPKYILVSDFYQFRLFDMEDQSTVTNTRIVCFGNEYLIGAREFILHHSSDLYYDNTQGIVDGLKSLKVSIPKTNVFTVIYGEFYGGKTSSNSKWYGQDKNGFRVFDISVYDDLSILEMSQQEISRWRERETVSGIVYGQTFLSRSEIESQYPDFKLVPLIDFELGDLSHKTILENLEKFIPTTNVALSENAIKKAEGLVLRNASRSKIVKVKYEDYERTLR